MTIRRIIPALTLTAALVLGPAALAQESGAQDTGTQGTAEQATAQAAAPEMGLTLADLGRDQGLTAAVEKMAEGHQMPEWLREGAVISPSQTVAFGGQEYLAMIACKQHDCAENQFAVLYAPGSGTAHGVLSVRDGEGAELLTWLGMAGGPETIDGRTILYAALTGSLANHPQDFRYAE
ncbi:Inhibitor of vertebrate lysozyme (Ivy) [Paracoccus thiocyanatus]|uniref:Inhibitor of vertebrate lysozyme (Ivy) n=1 Tax=Paracoccus thiocyanatus TaxID=34006 RepID=A0A1N6PQQ6_9RHOB|nr:Ivy family C-type lysozyme inhibitor [Paracoccus thiocyanatus]SIQ06627.1 Inhibitor of vertebrate lysozyme (Ivy) [Paracoccus thiocyanatus]